MQRQLGTALCDDGQEWDVCMMCMCSSRAVTDAKRWWLDKQHNNEASFKVNTTPCDRKSKSM